MNEDDNAILIVVCENIQTSSVMYGFRCRRYLKKYILTVILPILNV